ncbi:MAG: hypothetical protein JSV83_03735 [Desulfobacterales bacterium]|nr:MAG: hypothetical protein JSV83_03735 [Desulfobacterales bacterium]
MNLNQITIAPVFPMGLIMLLFGLALAAVWVQYRVSRAKLGKMRALILSLLRLLAVAVLVAFALNPSLVTTQVHKLSPAIAIVVDTSDTMGQSTVDDPATRLDKVKALLTEGQLPLLRSLGDKFDVSVYGLSDSLRPLEYGDLAGLTAGGNKGDVAEALQALSAKNSVAVLFSDGNLRWSTSRGQQLSTLTVAVGNPKTYRDILITEVSAPALAFRGREVVIDITVKSYGYQGMTLPVLLQDSGKLLAVRDVRLQTDPAELTTSLSFVSDELGRKDLKISIPQQVGENIFTNNQINLTINVVRDKTRILMVSGSPSMNYRFMRVALKSDPSIDLLSFVILRTPSDILNVPPHEQSLIPFPVETLFLKELTTFDLLIFDNFNYSLFLSPDYLESIRSFVESGGGFALIGGPNLYNEGRDRLSPLGDILPFRFVEEEFYRRDSPVGLRLTRAGAEHPLMRVADDFSEDANGLFRFWQQLPPLNGINLFEVKGSADVLLESADGIAWPILTVADYRKGRVVAIASDYAWKWYMGMVASGKGNQFYLRLVHRMVRWLTKDPGLDPVQIILPETAAVAGQEIDVRIRYHGEDPSPRSDAAVSFSIFNPEGVKIPSQLKPTAQRREHLVSFLPRKGGIYRIRVETPFGNLEESMVVAGPLESLDAAPDHDQLKKIAASTGGKYLAPGDDLLSEIEEYARKAEKKFVEEKHLPIWATPFVMAIVLALLSSEWYFRRRWGLI